jgi:hypothetical protein
VERDVIERAIATGRIDPADYEAAHLRYVRCMAQHGFHPMFRKTADGVYVELPNVDVEDMAALDVASLGCPSDNMIVEILYRIQQSNPDLLADYRLLAIQCLKRGGFVDTGYTVEDFDRDKKADEFPFDPYDDGPSDCLYVTGIAYFEVEP